MKPENVVITSNPYIHGTRVEYWAGGLNVALNIPTGSYEEGFRQLISGVRQRAAERGVNCVMNAQFNLNPFAAEDFCQMSAFGHMAFIVPCWGFESIDVL